MLHLEERGCKSCIFAHIRQLFSAELLYDGKPKASNSIMTEKAVHQIISGDYRGPALFLKHILKN